MSAEGLNIRTAFAAGRLTPVVVKKITPEEREARRQAFEAEKARDEAERAAKIAARQAERAEQIKTATTPAVVQAES